MAGRLSRQGHYDSPVLRLGRVAALCALAGLLAGALAAAPAVAQEPRTAILAVWQAGPRDNLVFAGPDGPDEPQDLFLRHLGANPRLSLGLMASIQGDYNQEQALLDITQGTRQSTFIYEPRDIVPLSFQARGGGGRLSGWEADVRRAATVSTTLRPGLLASTIPGGAGYAGVADANADASIAAADRQGRIAAASLGPAATLAQRTRQLLASKRFVVVGLPADSTGLRALDQLIATRAPGELVLVTQLPFTPPERSVGEAAVRYFKQPAFAMADGPPTGSVTSGTTRQPGLVSSIDVAPTVLEHLGVAVPARMRGQRIEESERLSALRLEQLRRRWADVRNQRQSASMRAIVALTGVIVLLLGALRGFTLTLVSALRVGALGLMWWPAMVLASAALEPGPRLLESFLIAGGAVGLGALTDRFVAWPRGPLVPAAATLAFYTIDLAGGLHLLTRSVLGPSLAFGARFYGISNELEPLFPIFLLAGLAAILTGRQTSRRIALLYGVCGVVLGLIVGWGRLGADVGGVLTVAGAMAVATLVMLPGGITRRAVVIAVLTPVAALAALIAVDLALSGGSHLARNLLRAEGIGELWELVTRRYVLAFQALIRGTHAGLLPGRGAGCGLRLAQPGVHLRRDPPRARLAGGAAGRDWAPAWWVR